MALNELLSKKKWRPGGNELDYWYGMDEKKSPPMSIEDCAVVGSVDQGLNSTNHIPEVGGSQNR